MKKILLGISLLTTLSIACKVKATKENTSKENVKPTENKTAMQEVENIENKTLGKVSHRYRTAGCNTVIEVKLEEGEIQTLIPKDKLSQEFDVDGTELYFNFLVLRMPQPEGCKIGQPAEITDIVKKK
jgi:hypothetical protein